MNKFLLLSIILSSSFLSISQLTIYPDNLMGVNEYVILSTDNSPAIVHEEPGTDMEWDYSFLNNSDSEPFEMVKPSSLEGHSSFTKANIGVPAFEGVNSFIRKNGNGLDMLGIYGDMVGAGEDTPINFDEYERIIQFPLGYGTTYENYYVIDEEINFDGQTYRFVQTNDRKITVDSWGSLATPFGTYDAIRQEVINYQKTEIFTVIGGVSVPIDEEEDSIFTYTFWSDHEDVRFNLLEYTYNPLENVVETATWLNSEVQEIPEEPEFMVSTSQLCLDEVLTVTDVSSNVDSWTWDFGVDATPENAGGKGPHDVTYSSTGEKTIVLTSGDGTTVSRTIIVNEVPEITLGAVVNPTDCENSDGEIEVEGAGEGTLTWSYGGHDPESMDTVLPAIISGLEDKTYSMIFIDENGCSSNTLEATLEASNSLEAPVITADGDVEFCEGGLVTLTSDTAEDITWNTGEETQSIEVIASGDFSVTLKQEEEACSATSNVISVTVKPIPDAPTITVDGEFVFCEGDSATLTSSQALNNTWSDGAETQSIVVENSGSYHVSYTKNGCESPESNTVEVTVGNYPNVSFTFEAEQSIVCENHEAIGLEGNPSGGYFEGVGVVAGAAFDPGVAEAGTHEVTYTYTTEEGCSDFDADQVTVDGCASLLEQDPIQGIRAYPNPSNGDFKVVSGHNPIDQLEVIDATGRTIKSISYPVAKDQVNVNMNGPKNGVYIVKVTTAGEHHFIRMIVNN